MAPEIQDVLNANEDVYTAPDVTRLGTVEELTEGTVISIQGDGASGPG